MLDTGIINSLQFELNFARVFRLGQTARRLELHAERFRLRFPRNQASFVMRILLSMRSPWYGVMHLWLVS